MRLETALGLRLWAPQAGPQELAYFSPADVTGYGGAAGGGKSSMLLGLAINEHRRSVIFRREMVQGRGLVDDSQALLSGVAKFNGTQNVWRGVPGGRQIEFAGVKDPGDEHKHKGRAKDFIGFDEADQFTEPVVRFLMGWLRTTVPGQRCRVVLAFNPPSSAEGRWLLQFFRPWLAYLFPKRFQHERPAAPGELRWYATLPDGVEVERPDGVPFDHAGETITPKSRTFIPARVEDNAYLMATGYKAQLQSLPEPLRSQLLAGDFTAGLEDDPWQVIPTAWVEAAMARWKEGKGERKLRAIGGDIARGGKAKTVLAKRYDYWWDRLVKRPGSSTPDGVAVADLIGKELAEQPTALVVVDVIGIGSSVFDECRRRRYKVVGCNFGAHTDATDSAGVLRFLNIRAFAYWSLREALDPARGLNAALPPDDELLADLTAPRWQPSAGGIKIEEKKEIEKRLGRSPDCADAVVYSVITPT